MQMRDIQNKHTLLGVTLLVVLTHGLALLGFTKAVDSHTPAMAATSDTVFHTRTINVAATPPPLVPAPSQPAAQPPAKPVSRPTAPHTKPAPSMSQTGATATESATDSEEPAPATEQAAQTEVATEIQPDPIDTAQLPDNTTPLRYLIPPPTLLKYDIKGEIKGFAYFANGELRWQHQNNNYDTQLEISHFLLGSRIQTSTGRITEQGLEPLRFTDKVRNEVAAQIDHATEKITFSADGTQTQLEAGAQDQLSVFIQLGALLAGSPEHLQAGDRLSFQAVGARSAEHWTFEIGNTEKLDLPGGKIPATKLKRILSDAGATQVEVWLAPSKDFLPVRIRLFQANGDFVEQQWRSSRKP